MSMKPYNLLPAPRQSRDLLRLTGGASDEESFLGILGKFRAGTDCDPIHLSFRTSSQIVPSNAFAPDALTMLSCSAVNILI
jgi:hypothetical protein